MPDRISDDAWAKLGAEVSESYAYGGDPLSAHVRTTAQGERVVLPLYREASRSRAAESAQAEFIGRLLDYVADRVAEVAGDDEGFELLIEGGRDA